MSEPYLQLQSELDRALAGLESSQTQFTPPAASHKWSVQQIAEHLLLSYRSTRRTIQVRLDKGTPTKAAPTLTQRVAQFGIIALGHFPRGIEAPAAVVPDAGAAPLSGNELAALTRQALAELTLQAANAALLFGTRRRFASHLVLGPLSLAQWSRFHLIHGRHHIRQIQAIRRAHEA